MPDPTPEQERLRRLRDRQLAARDPHVKQRKLHRGIAARQRKARQPFSLRRMWSEIPKMWTGAFYGLVVGALALAIVPAVWDSVWATPCTAASIPLLAILGLLFGRAFDSRDELKDLIK